jgi:hypothetical protein
MIFCEIKSKYKGRHMFMHSCCCISFYVMIVFVLFEKRNSKSLGNGFKIAL